MGELFLRVIEMFVDIVVDQIIKYFNGRISDRLLADTGFIPFLIM